MPQTESLPDHLIRNHGEVRADWYRCGGCSPSREVFRRFSSGPLRTSKSQDPEPPVHLCFPPGGFEEA
jgi:hypothetical protein